MKNITKVKLAETGRSSASRKPYDEIIKSYEITGKPNKNNIGENEKIVA